MSILDDAIREHLELKRAHGADESELKKLEDEAFGPPARPEEPDPFAEAPTEFLTAPGEGAEGAGDAGEGAGRRVPNIADLQEAPPPREESTPPPGGPSIEEQPAMEHEAIPEPAPDRGHTTDEREAIADQPTEFFDVAADLESSSEAVSPSDEDLVEAGISEPRLAPVDPLSGIEASAAEPEAAEEELEDEEVFFSDQRLSEELDNALEAPITDEHPAAPPAAPAEEGTAIFDAEEAEVEEEAELEEAASDEHPAAAAEPESSEPAEPNVFEPETGSHDDVLEDTPDFLEDAPEDDDLWFEQRPPKDFDFDD